MRFDKFIELMRTSVDRHYERISSMSCEGGLASQGPILYPSMMLARRFEHHYLAEFIGLRSEFSGVQTKKVKTSDIDQYFRLSDQPSFESAFEVSDHSILAGIAVSPDNNREDAKERFPIVDLMSSGIIANARNVFRFSENFKSVSLSNFVIISRKNNFYRCRSILAAFLFDRSITKKELTDRLEYYMHPRQYNASLGYVVSGEGTAHQDIIVASHFQSLYLSGDIIETTIGEFLSQHLPLLEKALNTESIICQPHLRWIEHDGSIDENSIKPDLLVQRSDGLYDIYDLKTALLEKSSLLRNPSSRRRTIDYVSEGVAQLHNYAEYFEYEQNAAHAFEKYGVKVQEPRLYLVVGNIENVDPILLDGVLKRYNRDVNVIDYDSISMMLANCSKAGRKS